MMPPIFPINAISKSLKFSYQPLFVVRVGLEATTSLEDHPGTPPFAHVNPIHRDNAPKRLQHGSALPFAQGWKEHPAPRIALSSISIML
jgi:hypothetical protein